MGNIERILRGWLRKTAKGFAALKNYLLATNVVHHYPDTEV